MILEANTLYTSYNELDMKKLEKRPILPRCSDTDSNGTPVIIMMSYVTIVCKVRLQYSFLFIPY